MKEILKQWCSLSSLQSSVSFHLIYLNSHGKLFFYILKLFLKNLDCYSKNFDWDIFVENLIEESFLLFSKNKILDYDRIIYFSFTCSLLFFISFVITYASYCLLPLFRSWKLQFPGKNKWFATNDSIIEVYVLNLLRRGKRNIIDINLTLTLNSSLKPLNRVQDL